MAIGLSYKSKQGVYLVAADRDSPVTPTGLMVYSFRVKPFSRA